MNLFPSQEKGVKFLTDVNPTFPVPHRYLAWDMGTGKTVVACEALRRLIGIPILIICPHTVKKNWAKTLVEWDVCTGDRIQIIRTSSDRISFWAQVVIVNYELAITDPIYRQLIDHSGWFAAILDEAHRVQTLTSKTSARILGTKYGPPILGNAYHRWWLSGTPAQNGRPIELYPTLKTAAAELIAPYNTHQAFGFQFCNGGEDESFRGSSNIDELYERLKPFMSVQKLEDVIDLPETVYENVYLDIGSMPEDDSNTALPTLRRLVGNQKLAHTVGYVKDRITNDPAKVLIFTYHRDFSEQLAAELNAPLIYGGQSEAERDKRYNSFLSDAQVLVAQVGTAGQALDGFQNVCYQCIIAETNWIPDSQAIGRIRRNGQTRPMIVTRLIAEGTIDEPIDGSSRNKKRNIAKLIRRETMSDFDRIVVALESMAKSLAVIAADDSGPAESNGGGKGRGAKAAAKEAVALTMDDVRTALKEVTKSNFGGDEGAFVGAYVPMIQEKFKAGKTAEVDVKHYADLIEAVKALKPAAVGLGSI